jgi:hypothetical protein
MPIKQVVLTPHSREDQKETKAYDKTVAELEQYGMSREDIAQLEAVDCISFAATSKGAFFAYCSSSKRDEDVSLSKEEQMSLERGTKQLIIEGLIASLHRDAKIERNESFNLPMEDYLV